MQIYRSSSNRMIGGVCAGIAQYLRIDPLWVRLFFVVLTLGDGIGVLLYLILWAIIPGEERAASGEVVPGPESGDRGEQISSRLHEMGNDVREAVQHPHPQAGILIGAVLILLGVVFLLDQLNLPWLRWVSFDMVWPVLLVAAGVLLLVRQGKGS